MSRIRDIASILTASSVLGTDVEITTAVSDHSAASDPHTGYVLESLIDAKGDLIVGSADNTVARLAAGNSGESIVADSAATTGLRYSATPSASNPVLNSAMQIAQRGTTFTASLATVPYTLDRWCAYSAATTGRTISRQSTNDTTNLPFIQYCTRIARDSGNTATNAIDYSQSIETLNSIPFSGKSVTVSFYARAGGNYSATSSFLDSRLYTGTGTDQNNLNAGFTGSSLVATQNNTLTTTWQRFTMAASIGATSTEIELRFRFTPVGTASTNDWYEITGVQIDIGSVALPFRTYAATIQGELAACQRYYFRASFTGTSRFGIGFANTTTDGNLTNQFPVEMRIAPTALEQSGTAANYTVSIAGANVTCSAVPTLGVVNQYGALTTLTFASGLTAGAGLLLRPLTGAYLGWSAEL